VTGRNPNGTFAPNNPFASVGGKARMARLTPQERRQLASSGFQGLVQKRFEGDTERAKLWLGKVGAWAADQVYAGTSIYKPADFAYPGAPEDFRRRA
jgi:hypothetical protein